MSSLPLNFVLLFNIAGGEAASISSGLPSETMEKNERLVGYALYDYSYSPWNGRALYIEDLFVKEEYRSNFDLLFTSLYLDCTLHR